MSQGRRSGRVVEAGVTFAGQAGGVDAGVITAAAAVGAGGEIMGGIVGGIVGVVVVPVAAVAAVRVEEEIVGFVAADAATVTRRQGGILVTTTAPFPSHAKISGTWNPRSGSFCFLHPQNQKRQRKNQV